MPFRAYWSKRRVCNLQLFSELITTQLRISQGVTTNSLYLSSSPCKATSFNYLIENMTLLSKSWLRTQSSWLRTQSSWTIFCQKARLSFQLLHTFLKIWNPHCAESFRCWFSLSYNNVGKTASTTMQYSLLNQDIHSTSNLWNFS